VVPTFWPRAKRPDGRREECDLLLVLEGPSGQRWAVLVEVKYRSPKSQRQVDETDSSTSHDQLACYLHAIRCFRPLRDDSSIEPIGIVYLTAHCAPPKSALDESLLEVQRLTSGWN